MKVNGSHTFQAPRDVVWPMLQDPEILSKVMPGCEALTPTGEENQYEGLLKIKMGPIQGKFKGLVTLSNINEPESYDIMVNGRGPAGHIKGVGSLQLNEADGITTMIYDGDAQVNGRIATVGQRLMDTSARAIIRQSLEALDNQVETRVQPATTTATADEETAAPPPSVAAPTQTEFAAGVAKNFIKELIPAEQRDETFMKGAMLLGGLLFVRVLLNWWTKSIARQVAKIIQEEQ